MKYKHNIKRLNKYQQAGYLIKQLFHGVILPQQVVDLILAVNRCLAFTGAAEILGHLTGVVLIFLKVPPLRQLHGKMRNMRHTNTKSVFYQAARVREGSLTEAYQSRCVSSSCSLFKHFLPFHGGCIPSISHKPAARHTDTHKPVCSSLRNFDS